MNAPTPLLAERPLAVILVGTQQSGNIGMVCRAMANFGVSDLRLVAPACQHLHPEAHKFAVSASHLLGSARIFPDLASALADLHFSVATTRRMGENRSVPLQVSDLPEQLAALPAERGVGLVFGREDSGLTSAEVALCSCAASIPSAPACGSLNLAQAVVVSLYELARQPRQQSAAPAAAEEMPTQRELEDLFVHMEATLGRIAFFKTARPSLVMNRLRRIYRKAELNRDELNLLLGLWDQVGWSVRDWQGRKKGARGEAAEPDPATENAAD